MLSAYCAMAPGSSSAGAQISADRMLAIQKRACRHARDTGHQRDYRAQRPEEAPNEDTLDAVLLEEGIAAGQQMRMARKWPARFGEMAEAQAQPIGNGIPQHGANDRTGQDRPFPAPR